MKTDTRVRGLLLTILGLLLTVKPDLATNTISKVVAIVLVINGVVNIVGFITNKPVETSDGYLEYGSNRRLITGILSIVFAGLVGWAFVSIIPIILGVLVLGSGIIKLTNAMEYKKMTGGNVNFGVVILAVINIILGLVVLCNPFGTANMLLRVIGIGMIYAGITDLIYSGILG